MANDNWRQEPGLDMLHHSILIFGQSNDQNGIFKMHFKLNYLMLPNLVI